MNSYRMTDSVSGTSTARVFVSDEGRLVERIKIRYPGTMAELYDRFAPLVYSVILHSVRNQPVAEDLTLEAFLCVWNRIHSFDESRTGFERWVALIASNRALDYLRAWYSRPAAILTEAELMAQAS